MDTSELIAVLKILEDYKLSVNELLDIMMSWYRDVLLYKATMDEDAIVFKDEKELIIKEAQRDSYEGIENVINVIGKTKQRIRSNVNFELAMELMLLTIKEN